jgi:hypothetical protein
LVVGELGSFGAEFALVRACWCCFGRANEVRGQQLQHVFAGTASAC